MKEIPKFRRNKTKQRFYTNCKRLKEEDNKLINFVNFLQGKFKRR